MSRSVLLFSLLTFTFACGGTTTSPEAGEPGTLGSNLVPCPSFVPPLPCPGRLVPAPALSNGCEAPPTCETSCGGLLGLQCAEDAYCNWEDNSCGAADQIGTCEFKPEACAEIYAPVCACDDKTYGNACEAAMAGVSVVSVGHCQIDQLCGSRGLAACPNDYVCIFEPSASCGRTDKPGRCEPVRTGAEACLAIYDPVCGCDGVTYSNDCEARRVNASVDHKGECKP